MERATGFEGPQEAMAGDEAFVAVAEVDRPGCVPAFTWVRRSPLIADLSGGGGPGTGGRGVRRPGGHRAMAAGQEFRQTGTDSLLSVELRDRLARATGPSLPPTPGWKWNPPARPRSFSTCSTANSVSRDGRALPHRVAEQTPVE